MSAHCTLQTKILRDYFVRLCGRFKESLMLMAKNIRR